MKAPIDTTQHPDASEEVKDRHYRRIKRMSAYMQKLLDPDLLAEAMKRC